jgi:hypothetical protein
MYQLHFQLLRVQFPGQLVVFVSIHLASCPSPILDSESCPFSFVRSAHVYDQRFAALVESVHA